MPDASERSRYRISRITAEFVDSRVELAFRQARHGLVVRDIRFAFGTVVVVMFGLTLSDYLVLGPNEAFRTLLISRILVSLFCLLVVLGAARIWRSLMDGVTQTLVEAIGVAGFLSMTLLRPYEPGWHGMSMMLILFGLYIFAPNRFLYAFGLASIGMLVFVVLLNDHFQLAGRELLNLCILLATSNLLGARALYRSSWRVREEFRNAELHARTQAALQRESELRVRIQAERDALEHLDLISGNMKRRQFHDLVERTLQNHRIAASTLAPITLLRLETDYFRQLSDTYGQHHAEAIETHLFNLAKQALQCGDEAIVRVGDASFFVILTGCDQAAALSRAELLRSELYRTPLKLPSAAVYITASQGIAQWQAGETGDNLMRRTDAALAAARTRGGNRVVQADAVAAGKALEPTGRDAQNAIPDPLLEQP